MFIKIAYDPKSINELLQVAKLTEADVVDVSPKTVIIRFAGESEKIDRLLEMLKPTVLRR